MSKKSKNKLVVSKSLQLNAMHHGYDSLREYRIFETYLAKINPLDPETRTVRFSLEEFAELCNIKNYKTIRISDYKIIIDKFLNKTVSLPTDNGGLFGFVLFEKCLLDQDKETLEWFFEITATQTATEFFFKLKKYFSFELKNVLKLKSINQIRLYEILKQREYRKEFDISLLELRELLFIESKEYLVFNDFKRKVLDVCQKYINDLTDISFTYTTKRTGRKISTISFLVIPKNTADVETDSSGFINTDISTKKTSYKKHTKKTIEEQFSEIEEAKKNPLWRYALNIANIKAEKNKLEQSVERYTIGILKNWEKLGIKTPEELKTAGHMVERHTKLPRNTMICFKGHWVERDSLTDEELEKHEKNGIWSEG